MSGSSPVRSPLAEHPLLLDPLPLELGAKLRDGPEKPSLGEDY